MARIKVNILYQTEQAAELERMGLKYKPQDYWSPIDLIQENIAYLTEEDGNVGVATNGIIVITDLEHNEKNLAFISGKPCL